LVLGRAFECRDRKTNGIVGENRKQSQNQGIEIPESGGIENRALFIIAVSVKIPEMKTPEEIAQLLFRHVCRELTPEEKQQLAEWRGASPENEQVFRDATDREYVRREIDFIHRSKDRVYQHITKQYPFTDTIPKTSHPGIYRLLRIAAMVVVSLGVTFFLFSIDFGGPEDSSGNGIKYQAALTKPNGITIAVGEMKRGYADGKAAARREREVSKGLFLMGKTDPHAPAGHYYTMHTEKAEQYGLQLPGGARFWLNEKSTVKYPANYSADSGKISIEGEAYVELAENKNAHSPFLISLQNMRLELGRGLFNVRAYPGDSVIITAIDGVLTLDTGSIRSAPAVVLHPSEQAQIIHGQLNVLKNIDILKTIGWRNRAGKQ
jgi:ferric-dicitrate binding protein FerR (iron transport regulator)